MRCEYVHKANFKYNSMHAQKAILNFKLLLINKNYVRKTKFGLVIDYYHFYSRSQ